MMTYIASDDSGTRVEIDASSTREAAQKYVDGGEWGPTRRTIFHRIVVWPADADADEAESIRIVEDPTEPTCPMGQHDWKPEPTGCKENPGVRGHGGGVIIAERCRCGQRKVTDTWATDPNTGEQGFTQVSYPDDYDYDD